MVRSSGRNGEEPIPADGGIKKIKELYRSGPARSSRGYLLVGRLTGGKGNIGFQGGDGGQTRGGGESRSNRSRSSSEGGTRGGN